jgi:hypothetical protein
MRRGNFASMGLHNSRRFYTTCRTFSLLQSEILSRTSSTKFFGEDIFATLIFLLSGYKLPERQIFMVYKFLDAHAHRRRSSKEAEEAVGSRANTASCLDTGGFLPYGILRRGNCSIAV